MLLHSLAIGTSITWGGLFSIAVGDEPLPLRPSGVNPTFLPVQAISASDDAPSPSQFESSRRTVARDASPLPLEPPATKAASDWTAADNQTTTPKQGTWVPRGSHSLRTTTSQRFTPWTTPTIDRRSTTKSTESTQRIHVADRSNDLSTLETTTETITESTRSHTSGGQTPPSMERVSEAPSKLRAPEPVERNEAAPEAILVRPTQDDPAPAPLPSMLNQRSETTQTLEATTESSRRTRIARRESTHSVTEQHSSSHQSTETETVRSGGPRELEKLEIHALVPVKPLDSNEPTEDIVEPSELQPVPQEENTDGDIDAESLEKLRAAIRSFPGRSAAQEEHDVARSPSDHEVQDEGTASSSTDVSQAPERRRSLVVSREVQSLQPHIARVLTDYHRRPENVAQRSPWGTFHLMLPFGADANVQAGRSLQNSIAWLCSNRPCRGQRLITTTKSGRIYVRQGPGLQGHQAQLLAMLAQVNVEATYPITDGRTRFTIEDLIRAEMADCRRGQELTFSLIGLSHYLPTDTRWRASDGSVWSFETLLAEELAQPIVGAACGGTHRLMGLSYALRQRRMEGLPIEGQWLRADAFIKDFVSYAWSLQNRDGSFSTNWFEGPQDNREIDRKIQTTGHILEWLIFTADQDELQDPRFVRSVQFLTNAFSRYRTHEWQPGPKGHVLRALAVYHRRVYGDARPWANDTQLAQPAGRTYR
ncbi:hypothetical protein [Rosistilla carotiformis]|nr:hypothetical protein [Rosistilla carotiformis]